MENVGEKNRERAVALGQMLMHRGIIRHVTNTQPFSDGNYFYRFTMVGFVFFMEYFIFLIFIF